MTSQEHQNSILTIPLNELTRFHGGENGLRDRLEAELETTDWSGDDISRVNAALAMAFEAHENDSRGPFPYSTHFLRVAIRIMSQDHFAIRDNPDLIIAALLHDTIEDHPDFYLDEDAPDEHVRPLALEKIEELFGEDVSHLVSRVTNPPSDPSLPKEERNVHYRDHVVDVVTSEPIAGIIKLSDFIDNCAGLKHNESPERAKRLAYKYYDLIPAFAQFISESEYFDEPRKEKLLQQLGRAEIRCTDLMDEAA